MNSTPTRLTIIFYFDFLQPATQNGGSLWSILQEGQKPPPPFLPTLPTSDHPARGRVPAGLRRADTLAPTLRTRARPDAATADCRHMIHFTKKHREAAPAFTNRLRTPRPTPRQARSLFHTTLHTHRRTHTQPHRSQPPKGTHTVRRAGHTAGSCSQTIFVAFTSERKLYRHEHSNLSIN